ncbi:hypothetical protein MCOR14_000620 [Pyricularia oryzae]|nr:hypothetical protein MCOR14_000620 [Pyricularia oryzae]
MRVPCRLPDQDTICTAQNLSSVPRSPASSSARTSRRVRTTGEVEGFGRSQVWEMAVCTVPSWRWLPFPAVLVVLTVDLLIGLVTVAWRDHDLPEPGTIQCSRICRSQLANLA